MAHVHTGCAWPRRFLLSAVLAPLLPTAVFAAERLPIKAYTTADGLAHNDVGRIVRDSRGFLWFCTADGLSRFDGYSFVNFGPAEGLPHGRVNDLLETRSGEYYVATEGGLVRFDPRGTPATRIGTPDEPRPAARGPMFTIIPAGDDPSTRDATVLFEAADGTLWIGTEGGLYRMSGRSDTLQYVEIGLPPVAREGRIIADLLQDPAGTLWIGTPAGLYRREPSGETARFTRTDGLPADHVADLFTDRDGRLWVASRRNGFFSLEAHVPGSRAPPRVHSAFPSGVAPHYWIFRILRTSDGRFLLATARGLAELNPDARRDAPRFEQYSIGNGLTHHDITDIVEDVAGNLWLATNRAGVMKLARSGMTTFGETDGFGQIGAIFADRTGNLCFRATTVQAAGPAPPTIEPKLGCFDGRGFTWFVLKAVQNRGWATERVTLRTPDGHWWLGTGEGLYQFAEPPTFLALAGASPRAIYTTADGLAAPQVYRLFADSRGDIWISTIGEPNGLARWERRGGRVQNLAGSPGLPALDRELGRAFAEDASGRIWIGFDSGIARSGPEGFEFFGGRDGIPVGAIRDVLVDRAGRVWLASARAGVVRVDHASGPRPVFVTLGIDQGLSSNNVEVLAEGTDGFIYIGGGRGLDRLDPATGRTRCFTTADGLSPGIFRAAFRDQSGVLWFGTSGGLTRFAPRPEKNLPPPAVQLRAVRVTGVPQPVSALGENDMWLPVLSSRRNQVEIDFSGLNFASAEVLRYRYRLEGSDAAWSPPTDRRTVTYAGLRPGDYRFLVQAISSDGTTSPKPATLQFTILPPLWLRWWFLAALGLGAAALVYGGHRYRVARVLEIANVRTRIATDLHDDIGANLTRIALLSEVAARNHGQQERAPLDSIAHIARESVSSMSDIVWAIKPARETLLDLTRRMRQHAEEIFTLRDIELTFIAPRAGDSQRLGVDVRRDLLLIFKEAVSNCARHSGCSAVRIELRLERAALVLSVADNGIGFTTSDDSEGQGLASMQRRARRLRARLEITSRENCGTTVCLHLPL